MLKEVKEKEKKAKRIPDFEMAKYYYKKWDDGKVKCEFIHNK